ncbi:unnamed protein product [Brassica napus]|uniref:(rape) hypothetical protein n=1 Tax=Brassica napus TaxID=3708 RepID=A0A816WKI0_BRANA|nr:unnamed protein product [Brassica napus]
MGLHPVSEANASSPFGSLSAAEFYSLHSVAHSSAYITNPTGLKLFTQWWTPLHRPPLGLIAVVHGFTGESSWFLQLTSVLFAKSGFLTCAIDHQGHGFSDGLTAHIPNINLIVDDCISFFDDFRSRHASSSSLPSFLYSESLGGAIALYITLRQKSKWNGLILSGAMCSISHKFKPPWPLQHLLTLAATLIPTWRVVPTRGTIAGVSFKEPWKRKLAFANPNRTVGKPRAATAYELVRVCEDLQSRFEEVEVPLMIVHGGDDVVCDPSSVEELYMRCKSRDKTIKIYPGMWHQLIGESEENVDFVFGDVLEWIKNRSQNDAVSNGEAIELKMKDIMKEVEGKVKFSMADSTMMLLVQQAMDKAHEKIKTKHGLLLRLNAISLFYELAVLQLQSCLNFVQQETDNLESNHEEVVRDLRKIKDRLHHRLLETELAILEKDRELLERSENEASLRNVLESKETELVHLQDLERKRSSCNEIGEEFSELKSSVDHQVMNLRQKIETEYDGLGKEADDPSGVDIDVLKGTMDLAFNKMHHAIFLSELGPIEQSWRWSVERETMGLLIKGFMSGLEEEKKRVMMVVRDYELGFKDRVCLIRREVECLESQIIIQRSSSSPRAITTSSSSVDCEVVNDDKEEEGEGEEDSSNYPVSKLIKSHESIIRRKSEELVSPKIESIKRQRSCNSSSSKRAVDDIVSGLDSLVCLNTKMFEYFCYDEDDDRCDEHEVVMDDGLDDVWKKVQKHRAVLSGNEVEEKEDVEMKLMILEDTYLTLLRGLLTDNKRLLVEQEKMACLDKSLVFDGYESLCEDEVFRQEVNLIIVREFLREMSETVENHERVKADNRRLFEEQGKWACLDTSPVFNDLEILREDEECRQEVDWIIVRELLREFSETVENHERTEADNKRLFEEQVKRACLDRSIVSDDFEILREGEEFRQEVDSITVTELLREVSETVDNQERIQANNKRLLEKEGKMACLDTSLAFDDFEILCEDGVFRQEVDWIVVRELLREVSETVENLERIEAENKRLLEEQGKRACMEIFLVFDDFNFKIQERLKMATLGLQNLGKNIDSTMDYMAELRRKESVYKTAFVLRCENLIKAETEVDLLGDQVDSLVKLLQKTLWTFHQHPLLLCNHSDVNIRSVEGCVDAIKKATKGDSRGLDKECCDAISGLTNDCLPIIFSGGPAIGLLVKAACTHKFDDAN